ncbi:MAG TPA: CpaF family protein [Lachnospiraceae bacterium]|nr:CpaF family protein [Lachnospiraceae bacterium]
MTERSEEEQRTELMQQIREQIDLSREVSDEEVLEAIDECIIEYSKTVFLSLPQKSRLRRELFNTLRRLDILQDLVDDPEITEIMVNGTEPVFIEKQGRLIPLKLHFETRERLEDIIQQIVAKTNRVVNMSSPIVDARLDNGARVNAVLQPVAINGPILTIRRFPDKPLQMEDMFRLQTISKEAADFLKILVKAGYNIMISGGTGSGKTTFLNVLSGFIPEDERIITIEDSAELQLQGIDNLVRLEVRNANMEGCKEITIRDLIKTALRMRPDRLIIGEVRGAEAVDLLQSFNTGHDGSISTAHANSAVDLFSRMEMMMLMGLEMPLSAIRRQLAAGIDIVIHLGRLRDKSRRVLEIAEVIGMENDEIKIQSLYLLEEEGEDPNGVIVGKLQRKAELQNRQKLIHSGLQ